MVTRNMHVATKLLFAGSLLLLAFMLVCCGTTPEDEENSSSGDSDSDTDSDTDSDSDSDGDGFEAAEEVGDLVGRTFVLDEIGTNQWISPPGLGKELGSSVPPMAFQIMEAGDGKLTALLGVLDGNEQDSCSASVEIEGTIDDDPDFTDDVAFSFEPVDLEMVIRYDEYVAVANIRDLTISGYFMDGATGYGFVYRDAGLIATVDFRDIAVLFSGNVDDPTPDNMCEKLSELYAGVECEDCPHDGEKYCVTLEGALITAEAKAIDLEEIDDIEDSCVED